MRFERSREANPEVQEELEGPSGVLGGVGRPTRGNGRGWETHLEVREAHP